MSKAHRWSHRVLFFLFFFVIRKRKCINLVLWNREGKRRTGSGSQQGDLTAPKLVITKGNRGSPGDQVCILAKHGCYTKKKNYLFLAEAEKIQVSMYSEGLE